MRLFILVTCVVACLGAQEEIPGGRGGRGGRGGTREFLGLGPPPDAAAAARGEKLYAANCGFCHGEKARGAEGPNLVRSPLVLHDEKAELLGPAITRGFPDKGMPPFPSFAAEQLYDIAQYLHLQVELVANRGTYKRLNVVTGDARAGEIYFRAHCSSCHSTTGDLAHVGSRFEPDQLQTRFVWPAGRGGARQKATVTLPSGEVISGNLKKIDDIDISIYDAAGNYRSWPRDRVKVELEDRLAEHRKLLERYTDTDMHNLTAYLVTLK